MGQNPSQLPAGEGSVPRRVTDGFCEQPPGCKTSQELPPLTHLPAHRGGRRQEVLQYVGKGTSPGSARVGEEQWGYIKEVGEKVSRTGRRAQPG